MPGVGMHVRDTARDVEPSRSARRPPVGHMPTVSPTAGVAAEFATVPT